MIENTGKSYENQKKLYAYYQQQQANTLPQHTAPSKPQPQPQQPVIPQPPKVQPVQPQPLPKVLPTELPP